MAAAHLPQAKCRLFAAVLLLWIRVISAFTEQLITASADSARSVYATDVNGDGAVDILVASLIDDKVRLFLNDGVTASPDFTEQLITASADGAYSVYATDVNGDGFVDILVASHDDDKVRLFLNDGDTASPDFTEQLITASAVGAWSVYATDVNGDGSVDILVASLSDDKVRLFLNDPYPTFSPTPFPSPLPNPLPTPSPSPQPIPSPTYTPSPAPSPLPTTHEPTMTPTFSPTMRIEKIEYLHFVIIAVTTFCVFGLTLFVRFDMEPYQKQRIGYLNVLVVSFAWLDFIGDLTWTWQRFHAYFVRGEEEQNLNFGIISAVVLILSTMMTSYSIFVRILMKHKTSIQREKITSNAFISLMIISFTDPDVIMFFPWKEDSYELTLESIYPNDDCIRVTLLRLWEDVPECLLQIAYLAMMNFDVFTMLNLVFTIVTLMYIVIGKLLVLVLDPGNGDERKAEIELNTMSNSASQPTHMFDIVKDLKRFLPPQEDGQIESVEEER